MDIELKETDKLPEMYGDRLIPRLINDENQPEKISL